MFSPFFHVAAFATLFAAVLAQGDLTINTPSNVEQCQPSRLSWSAGTPPYTIVLTAGSAPSGSTTGTIASDTSDTEVTYTPGEGTANTQIVFNIRDSTGKIAQTGIITVGGDSASTCQTSASGGGSSATGSASGSSGSSQTTGSSGSASTSKSSASHSGSATGSASGASSSGSSAPDAASANFQGAGIAGVVGAALVAFLA
ncbi:hypothetical protein CYLTODRAFT_491958 [Cylindrobasidium torrendii FP15055 ss-10]|uniref:GPI anchored protein n=1 Tax=Cylindrobasidium torrendii FP15055 ss-10 TaxID=1314674 RepID=A0A0D7B8M8_9AGAR|nr:hypothetical protein CYLTODRAFT_491958 [Cylindrobasidium torrendii FP15055 ss-10]